MSDARLLAMALTRPAETAALDDAGWTALLTMARAELLLGTLACRLDGPSLPGEVQAILADARAEAEHQRRQALWEAEMARRALAGIDVPVVLLKGTAYVAAGLAAGRGRHIGDLDILVPHGAIDQVETALIAAGWEWVKPNPYDDAYYRRWMHELPPLIHRDRDRMIDVHHTILPLTARPTPDADALIANAVPLQNELRVLAPADMIVHAAAHLFADGDLAGGMRNLWDIDRLLREFGDVPAFWFDLGARADQHALGSAVARAARQASALYDTPIPETWRRWDSADPLFARRIVARDGWGRATRPVTRLGFYLRSHALRMPPGMLARHLWTKWRRGSGDIAR
jgi:Uncharacterised nucleotidyltransferase